MKKALLSTLTLLVAAVILMTSAMAANFVPSIEQKGAPTATVVTDDPDNCVVWLQITAYKDRDTLPDSGAIAEFEEAYNSINSASNLGDISSEFATYIKNNKINVKDLVVRDLFDASIFSSDGHAANKHAGLNVALKTDPLYDSFVALLYYYNGKWSMIDSDNNLQISGTNNDTISFHIDTIDGQFAIITKTASSVTPEPKPNEPHSPKTGDIVMGVIVVLAIAAIGGIFFIRKGLKQN